MSRFREPRGAGHHAGVRGALAAIAVATLVASTIPLSAQMPDLRQMSGQPLPSPDLPAGTISVRVVRGSMSNNVPGQDVELRTDGGSTLVRTVKTDQGGRAVFSGLAPGATYRAVTTIDGAALVSQDFPLPAAGGVRLLLVAGLASGESKPAAPAAPGTVGLGSHSRIVFELAEESVEVFVLLDLVNPLDRPASLASPLAFDLPDGVENGTVLEESATLGKIEGRRVIVAGPVPAGTTTLQFAYRIPSDTGTASVRQVFPMALPQGTVIVRKQDALQVTLEGEQNRRDVTLEGRTYLVLARGASAPRGAMDVSLSGLPARARWPRYAALGLSALIVVAGLYWASGGHDAVAERKRLQAFRAKLFGDLVGVERRLRGKDAGDLLLADRRAALVGEIAEIDAALEAMAPPREAEAGRASEARTAPSSALQ
jgi:hypothetical protein